MAVTSGATWRINVEPYGDHKWGHTMATERSHGGHIEVKLVPHRGYMGPACHMKERLGFSKLHTIIRWGVDGGKTVLGVNQHTEIKSGGSGGRGGESGGSSDPMAPRPPPAAYTDPCVHESPDVVAAPPVP